MVYALEVPSLMTAGYAQGVRQGMMRTLTRIAMETVSERRSLIAVASAQVESQAMALEMI